MATIPVYANHGRTIWGHALVDDEFAPLLQHFHWTRWLDNSPPRTNIYIPARRGGEQASPVFMHRLVYLLSLVDEGDRPILITDYTGILVRLREIPRLKLTQPENVLDCRLANIDGRLKKRSVEIFLDRRTKLVDEREGLRVAGIVKTLKSEADLASLANDDKAEAAYQRSVRIRQTIIAQQSGDEANDLAGSFATTFGIANAEMVARWDAFRMSKGWPVDPKYNGLRPEASRVPADNVERWIHEGSDKLRTVWSDDVPATTIAPSAPPTNTIPTTGLTGGAVRLDPRVREECEGEVPPPPVGLKD